MSVRLAPALVLLPLLLSACAHVGKGQTVLDDMSVEGNQRFSEAEIEERLALAETPDWPWADPQFFDRGTLAGDRRRLLRFYRSKGHYDAKVKSRVTEKGGKADVVFVVDEGPATIVEGVAIRGIDDLPKDARTAVRSAPLPLVKGQPIDEDLWDETKLEVPGGSATRATPTPRCPAASRSIRSSGRPGPRSRSTRARGSPSGG